MRTLARLSNALALALLLFVCGALVAAPPRFLFGTLFGDDAGYYLAIARNVLLGHGASYDRLHPTNGFNPLMSLLLIAVDRVAAPGLDLARCLRLAGLVSWTAVALSCVSLRRLCGRVFPAFGLPAQEAAAATAAVTWFAAGFVALKSYYGMDAFLVWALGLAYLARVARAGPLEPGWRAALADGALLGAAVLARVDTLPLAVAAFAVMLPGALRDPVAARRAAARAGVLGAIVVPYFAWNWRAFGDWLPISARLKSSFPHWDPAASLRAVFHTSLNPPDALALVLGMALSATWCAVRLARWRSGAARRADPVRSALDIWALYLASRLTWLLLFSRLDVQGSYFILVHAFLALGLLLGAWRLAGGRALRAAIAALVVATFALAALKGSSAVPALRDIASGRDDGWAIARRVHDVTRDGDVIYGGAFGLIGYLSDRPWINGDGVANDRGYQDAIRDHALARRLERDGTTHVAVAVPRGTPLPRGSLTLAISSLLHGVDDTLWVDPAGLVLREPMRRGGGSELWLFRAGGDLGRAPR